MKMPHVDDHTIRSSQSPHPPHQQQHGEHHHEGRTPRQHQSYYYEKRPSEAELSPHLARHEAHSPHHDHHHWRPSPHSDPYYNPHQQQQHYPHPSTMESASISRSAFHDAGSASAASNVATPPPSPHVHPRYDYSTYDSHYRGGPSVPPYSHRGGYSYYHHHPHSRPPMMPRDMHPYTPPPAHYHHAPPPHPADAMSPPPPYTGSYHHLPQPRYETPPLSSGAPTTSHYHDQQYPNFLPPSASMSTTASSRSGASLVPREEEEYSYESPQATSSTEEVSQVGPNDVLCGRGAPTNYHPGNEYFRDLVKQYQSNYLASKRADKPLVATHVVNIIQSRGGRFLRRYKRNGVSWERGHFVWVEVDPQKAYEKACQALREGAPEIRRKMQTVETTGSDADDGSDAQGERESNSKPSPKEDEAPKETSSSTSATCKAGEEDVRDTRNEETQDSERS